MSVRSGRPPVEHSPVPAAYTIYTGQRRLTALVLCIVLVSCTSPAENPAQRTMHPVDAALSEMSLERIVGQRFMGWIPAEGITPETEELERLIDRLQAIAAENDPAVPLLFAADQEGGRVRAVRSDRLTVFPPLYHIASHRDPEVLRAQGYISGVELKLLNHNQ